MAWIRIVGEGEAPAELAELYERVRDPASGKLDNVLSIHGLHPAGLRAHLELYRAVMRGSPSLRAVERELIALVVSLLNGCHY